MLPMLPILWVCALQLKVAIFSPSRLLNMKRNAKIKTLNLLAYEAQIDTY
jgi:hypothetical protein